MQDKEGKGKKIPVKSEDSDRTVWISPETLKKKPGKYKPVQLNKAEPPVHPSAKKSEAPKPHGKVPSVSGEHKEESHGDSHSDSGHDAEKHDSGHDGDHDEHHDHEAPKKSWKESFKNLNDNAKAFFKSAPKVVQGFISNPHARKKTLHDARQHAKTIPRKFVQNLIKTAKEEVHEFKMAGSGVKAVLSGKKMTHKQKHAFKQVVTHLAIGVAAAALTSTSVLGAAAALAKGMARHIAAKAAHHMAEKAHLMGEGHHILHGLQHLNHLRHFLASQQPSDRDAENAMMKFVIASVNSELKNISDEDMVEIMNDSDLRENPESKPAPEQPPARPEAKAPSAPKPPAPMKPNIKKEARVLQRFLAGANINPTPQVSWAEINRPKPRDNSIPTPKKIHSGAKDADLIRALREVAEWVDARMDLDFRSRRDTADMMHGLIRDVQSKKKGYETYVLEILNDTIETFGS